MRFSALAFFSAFLLIKATSASAEPSAQSACSYFGLQIGLMPEMKSVELADPIELNGSYELLSRDLDRYETYVLRDVRGELGTKFSDGTMVLTGMFSATFVCKVDSVDRRVLTVGFTDSDQVGKEVTLSNERVRKLSGVEENFVEIGTFTHQGKY